MATPLNPIQAMLAAKAGLGPAPQGAPMAPPVAPPAPFPSTDPTAVTQMLNPLAQVQQADQAQLAQEQASAASGAMQMLLDRLAAAPNPMAAAAQGGPARPVSSPAVGPNDSTPQGAPNVY